MNRDTYTHTHGHTSTHTHLQHRQIGKQTLWTQLKRNTHVFECNWKGTITHNRWTKHTLTVIDSLCLMISGVRPPRPANSPSSNGNLYTCDMTAVNQRGRPNSSKWQSRLQDMLTPSSSRAYAMGCAIITLLLLTVLLIFYFLGIMIFICFYNFLLIICGYFTFLLCSFTFFGLCNH